LQMDGEYRKVLARLGLNLDSIFTQGPCPTRPPEIVGLRPHWTSDLYWKGRMNKGGWMPTVSGVLGAAAPPVKVKFELLWAVQDLP
jgi:hypothetical protein